MLLTVAYIDNVGKEGCFLSNVQDLRHVHMKVKMRDNRQLTLHKSSLCINLTAHKHFDARTNFGTFAFCQLSVEKPTKLGINKIIVSMY